MMQLTMILTPASNCTSAGCILLARLDKGFQEDGNLAEASWSHPSLSYPSKQKQKPKCECLEHQMFANEWMPISGHNSNVVHNECIGQIE